MKIEVEIKEETSDWTLSEMTIDGKYACVGVEDEYREEGKKVYGETRIPRGKYILGKRYSPKFSGKFYMNPFTCEIIPASSYNPHQHSGYKPHELLWIKDIKGFEYVLIHWGNTDKDTSGCYIVGSSFAVFGKRKGVASSVKAYMHIYPQIMRAIIAGEEVTIEFKEKQIIA